MIQRTLGALCASLLLLADCGNSTPCAGSSCYPLSGNYLMTLTPTIRCPIWEARENMTLSSIMTVEATGGQIQFVLWPISNQSHQLNGTLYANGVTAASESTQNQILGIPYAVISGTFTSTGPKQGQPPFYFNGQIILEGSSQGPTGTGTNQPRGTTAGNPGATGATGCSAATLIQAEEQTTSQGFGIDAGTGDAGSADAGATDGG